MFVASSAGCIVYRVYRMMTPSKVPNLAPHKAENLARIQGCGEQCRAHGGYEEGCRGK